MPYKQKKIVQIKSHNEHFRHKKKRTAIIITMIHFAINRIHFKFICQLFWNDKLRKKSKRNEERKKKLWEKIEKNIICSNWKRSINMDIIKISRKNGWYWCFAAVLPAFGQIKKRKKKNAATFECSSLAMIWNVIVLPTFLHECW